MDMGRYATDYVGFVQLDHPNIRKIIRLEVFQGNNYNELASAIATTTISDYTNVTSVTLTLPNSGLSFVLPVGTGFILELIFPIILPIQSK
jgi:hypothetical protein